MQNAERGARSPEWPTRSVERRAWSAEWPRQNAERGLSSLDALHSARHVRVHFTSLAGRISSPLTLSRIPLTNLPLSWVENFLAISTASLMLTMGGMSSR